MDRASGRDFLLTYLRAKSIKSLLVMPEDIARIHLFVAARFVKEGRNDIISKFDETTDSDDGEGPGDVKLS